MSIYPISANETSEPIGEGLQFMQQLVRHMPGLLLVISLEERKIIFINKWGIEFLGISEQDIPEQEHQILTEIIHPDDYESLVDLFDASTSLKDEEERQIEVRLKTKEEVWHWFQLKYVAFKRDAAGLLTHIITMGQSIQATKEAVSLALEEKRRLKDTQSIGHIGSFEIPMPGNKVKGTDELFRIHGLEPQSEELTLQKIASFVHPEERQNYLHAVHDFERSGKPLNMITRIIWPDGSIRYVHRRAEFFRDDQGNELRIYGTVQDITDGVEARLLNQKQDQLMREAETVGHFGSYLANVDTMEFEFSDGMCRVLGHEPNAFVPTLDLIDANSHPDDSQEVRRVLQQAAIDKKPYEYCRRIYRPDGQMRYMHSQGKVILDRNGKAVQFLGIVRDVTAQKKSEEELKQKNELLEGVLNAPNVGINVYRAVRDEKDQIIDFECILMSESFKMKAGRGNRIGMRMYEVSPDRKKQHKMLEDVVETGVSTEELICLTKKGEKRWHHHSWARFGDGLIKVWEDITTRKLAEEELQASHHFIRKITETTPDILTVFDLHQTQLLYINRDFQALTGYNFDIFKNLGLDAVVKLIHPEDHEIALNYQKSFLNATDEEIIEAEFRFKTKEKEWRWYHIRGRVFRRDNDGNVLQYLSLMRDITEEKNTRAELIEAEKLSVQGGVARTLAHEVRGPAANIGLSLELLKNELSDSVGIPGEMGIYFDIIEKSCLRITSFINKLLTISSREAVDLVELDLAGLLDDSLTMAQDRIYLLGIEVKKSYQRGVVIHAERERMKIALLNIIINAIEAMEEQKGVLALSIREEGNHCILSIKDNGIGMTREQQKKMFNVNYTNKQNGLGVGLANVKAILQDHHARTEVRSRAGKGTEFIIYFPKNPL